MSMLYETDFYTWALEQARLLREGRLSELDIEHLAEEIEDMGKSEARGLQSQLERLIAHMLQTELFLDRTYAKGSLIPSP